MTDPEPNVYREWIADFVDETISDDRLSLLYEHLANDSAACHELVQQVLLDTELSDLLCSENVVAALDTGLVVGIPAPSPERLSRGRWFAVIFSMAALIVTTLLIVRTPQGQRGEIAARPQERLQPEAEEPSLENDDTDADNLSIDRESRIDALVSLWLPPVWTPVWKMLRLPAIQAAREAARREQSENNLRQIVLALHNFHDEHGRFPARYSADESGNALLSWRVHLLPYLEQAELYSRFRLDEPWDSEHNRALLSEMPAVFRSPETATDVFVTNYLAIASASSVLTEPSAAVFGESTPYGHAISDVLDGTSNTLMLVEASDDFATEWTRPVDFPVDADQPLQGLGHDRDRMSFLAAFADGAVDVISQEIAPELFLDLTTRDGGEAVVPP